MSLGCHYKEMDQDQEGLLPANRQKVNENKMITFNNLDSFICFLSFAYSSYLFLHNSIIQLINFMEFIW